MSRALDMHTLRAAILAGVNAAFDVLEQASDAPRRAPVRPPAQPRGAPSEIDQDVARRFLGLAGGSK